jgi:hypothetical protein
VLIRRELLIGPAGVEAFRPERHEDYGLWLRLFRRRPDLRYARLADPLMAYRLHAGSLSAQRSRSVFAVEKLLREHQPRRLPRLLLSGRWLALRLLETARRRLQARHSAGLSLDPCFDSPLGPFP